MSENQGGVQPETPSGGGGQPPPAATGTPSGGESPQERTWGMLCHLSAFAALLSVWLGSILGPLVVWLIKKNEFPFVDDQGKESLNFNISMTIYGFIAGLLAFVFIGIPILIALGVFWIVMVIMASIKANEGVRFRYPLTIRFIK